MEGVGHWHCLEASDEVVDLIEGFHHEIQRHRDVALITTSGQVIGVCDAVRACRHLGAGAVGVVVLRRGIARSLVAYSWSNEKVRKQPSCESDDNLQLAY